MQSKKKRIRIFISSPGDVVEERSQAKRVIEKLQQQYPELPDSEKEYDRKTAEETLKAVIHVGYTIERK